MTLALGTPHRGQTIPDERFATVFLPLCMYTPSLDCESVQKGTTIDYTFSEARRPCNSLFGQVAGVYGSTLALSPQFHGQFAVCSRLPQPGGTVSASTGSYCTTIVPTMFGCIRQR